MILIKLFYKVFLYFQVYIISYFLKSAAVSPTTTFTGTDTSNVDPDKILKECGITTTVITSNTSNLESSNNEENTDTNCLPNLQHHHIPGQSKALMKKYKRK